MTTYTLFRLSDRQAQKELATQRRYMQRHRAELAATEEAVPEAAPPQPVSTPAHRARAVRAAAVLRMLRFFILFSFPDVGKIRHRTEGYRKENRQKTGSFACEMAKQKDPVSYRLFGTTNSS